MLDSYVDYQRFRLGDIRGLTRAAIRIYPNHRRAPYFARVYDLDTISPETLSPGKLKAGYVNNPNTYQDKYTTKYIGMQ